VSNLFWINAAAGLTLSLIVGVSAPIIAWYFREPRLVWITTVLAGNFLLGGLTVQHEALLARQMKFGRKSLVRLLAFLFSTTMAVGLAHIGYGYWSLVWRELARSLFILIGVAWACPWLPSLPDRRTDVRELLSFGKDVTLFNFLGVVSANFDRVLIGRLFGARPVALYRQPYQLVVAPLDQLMNPLFQVSVSALSTLQSEQERFARYFRRVLSIIAMANMPLSVFLAFYSDEITLLVLGRGWLASASFLRIFAIGGVLRPLSTSPGIILLTKGRSRELLWLGIANSALRVALMSVGVLGGPEGVALCDVASIVIITVPYAYIGRRYSAVSLRSMLEAIARPLSACLGMACFLLVVRTVSSDWGPLATLSVGALAGVAGAVVGWLAMPGSVREARSLWADLQHLRS
jgi:PST family polysaccharide transporter